MRTTVPFEEPRLPASGVPISIRLNYQSTGEIVSFNTNFVVMSQLYHIVYPIREANRTRARPLEILCLGLPRSGTDSLKQALEQLGYKRVYHGFRVAENPGETVAWCRPGFAKTGYHSPDSGLFTAESFGRIIGDCDAVTDIPAPYSAPKCCRPTPMQKSS
jgi:hypothetical protein